MMILMSKNKLIIAVVVIIALICAVFAVSNFMAPSQASYDNDVFEPIGGDEFLNVTLKHCLKIDEKDIGDGSLSTYEGEIKYWDAKNITYVDTHANKDYFIVWKTTPDKYPWVKKGNENLYISTYLVGDVKGKCFVEYSCEDDFVYGVVVSDDFTESQLIYDILGLNKTGFDLVYSGTSSSSYSGGSSSHYHTVVPDRYTLSRIDPGSYYDHYEYGDNYEIDDYLESEGYE